MKERNQLIDIIKGAAIFCVVWGHCIQYSSVESFDFFENSIFKFIYSFHMPLLAIISGYLFCLSIDRRGSISLKKRVGDLFVPIIGGGVLCYYVLEFINTIQNHTFYGLRAGGWLSTLNKFWFIWTIISNTVIVGLIYSRIKQEKLRLLLLVLCAPFVYLFPNGDNNLFLYPYFVIGYLFYRYKDKIPAFRFKIKCIVFLLYILFMVFYEKRHYIYTSGLWPFGSPYGWISQIKIDIYRYIVGLLGCIVVISLVEWIVSTFKGNRLLNCIGIWGRNSLQIYILQTLIVQDLFATYYKNLVISSGTNVMTQYYGIYNVVLMPVLAIVFMFIIMFVIKILDKVGIGKYIFGR